MRSSLLWIEVKPKNHINEIRLDSTSPLAKFPNFANNIIPAIVHFVAINVLIFRNK